MISASTLAKIFCDVNHSVVEDINLHQHSDGTKCIIIDLRPYKREQHLCPVCGKRCPGYDHAQPQPRLWRALDNHGILVYLRYRLPRVFCPEHGVHAASVSWAFPRSQFTKTFDMVVTWMTLQLSKSAVASYMRIKWDTVGRCVHRAHQYLEPDTSKRLDGLVSIGIDETSYRKGHKYITIVVNHETNTVVWAGEGYGKDVLARFMESLTEEQRASIKTVTADGAQWITACVEKYLPNATRCIDSFHVVEWSMDALDKVRREAWRTAQARVRELGKNSKGRPKKDDAHAAELAAARKEAKEIKGSTFALGKAPENLTESQQRKLEMIQNHDNRLYRSYLLKEDLRLLLKMTDVEEAEHALHKWVQWARHCRIPEFVELQRKIMRHKDHILNTIQEQVSNARVESMNNKIKLIIRRAYGFRNIQNMIDLVMLGCSNIVVSLPNRPRTAIHAA